MMTKSLKWRPRSKKKTKNKRILTSLRMSDPPHLIMKECNRNEVELDLAKKVAVFPTFLDLPNPVPDLHPNQGHPISSLETIKGQGHFPDKNLNQPAEEAFQTFSVSEHPLRLAFIGQDRDLSRPVTLQSMENSLNPQAVLNQGHPCPQSTEAIKGLLPRVRA